MEQLPAAESIEGAILLVRGQRVMLDADLARLYDVSTSRLNEQARRNKARFPDDFMFRLTAAEWRAPNLSQFATGSRRHRDPARLPMAFTVERHSGKLTTHDAAILKLLAEIRRLTQFPEPPRRGIGFTANWPEGG